MLSKRIIACLDVRDGQVVKGINFEGLRSAGDPAELARRRKMWKAPAPPMRRGYYKLYVDHVLQANEGADLDFLVGKSGSAVPKDNH